MVVLRIGSGPVYCLSLLYTDGMKVRKGVIPNCLWTSDWTWALSSLDVE